MTIILTIILLAGAFFLGFPYVQDYYKDEPLPQDNAQVLQLQQDLDELQQQYTLLDDNYKTVVLNFGDLERDYNNLFTDYNELYNQTGNLDFINAMELGGLYGVVQGIKGTFGDGNNDMWEQIGNATNYGILENDYSYLHTQLNIVNDSFKSKIMGYFGTSEWNDVLNTITVYYDYMSENNLLENTYNIQFLDHHLLFNIVYTLNNNTNYLQSNIDYEIYENRHSLLGIYNTFIVNLYYLNILQNM
jgi:hypothetical protein